MMQGDTIAAIATAPGRGGVAIVRVSGPEALCISKRLTGRVIEPGIASFSRFRDEKVIDEGIVLTFKAPRSYTGEDVVEFQCHGGSVVPSRVLKACLSAGARLARRGEFTERAFINGRLDYDQAESVLDLVNAKTVRAADAALEGLSGRRQRKYRDLYNEMLAVGTELEHALDVDEGEMPDGFAENIKRRMDRVLMHLQTEIRRFREGKMLREGALVVLAGPPNAGKSSLMNALLDEQRAIVSETPGTTRDTIEEWIDIGGWPVRLVDTAGLRETGDVIEAEGVRRAEALIERADVVISFDSNRRLPSALLIHAKCDLGHGEGLNVSATTGEGIDALKQAIVARLESIYDYAYGEAESSREDVRLSALLDAERALRSSMKLDLVLMGNAVRTAAERLGSVVGAVYSADLLDKLFSRFCVGK